ncbi:MFS family permease [Allocatelliglobosispora scoriae]|uniref:MFS family permease n=1 Tax=Allocatelliglobosispora scoriae TaxID=643052 RepID=A0A841C053_9ACTN|nr:MFS transporter [Allocatelliglobosispora scoriae]MBB5872422.1 MFS family permease [Allocatelliglobosispora scoriae]
MYVTTPSLPGGTRAVPATVIGLGIVSLVTDASAEMVTAILPLYLVYGLGLGYLQLGLLDGLYTGATALLRLGGGHLADRWGRPKAVAVAGYGISALTKLAFPLVGASAAGIGATIAADRVGKGIRTAPRDAMITAATPPETLGRAFGVHRALDTAGALIGPLIAFALITLVAGGYDTVFVTSFCLGAIAVLILIFFVDVPGARPAVPIAVREGVRLLLRPELRRICLAAGLLGLLTVGDMFLFLAVQRSAGLPSELLPLLPLGTALTFMVAAIPVGRLADRLGRRRVFLAGHALLIGAYGFVAVGGAGWWVAGAALLLHGIFYAATDGVLMAQAGPLLPAELRASGLAVVQTVQALARSLGAVGFGFAAQAFALTWAFTGYAVALAAALGLLTLRAAR